MNFTSTQNAYVFFSFREDRDCLAQALRGIRHFDPSAKIAVFDDHAAPLPEAPDVDLYERTAFDRGGNLNGRECVLGMLACFHHVRDAWNPEFIIKIDCDTIPLDPIYYVDRRFDLLGSSPYPGICFGPCYVLRPRILPGALSFAARSVDLIPAEDQAISRLVREAGGLVEMIGFADSPRFLAGFDYVAGDDYPVERYRNCAALTFGTRILIDEEDPRATVARAMRAYLDHEIDGAPFEFSCAASYKGVDAGAGGE